jgi:hypothetical protein
MSPGSHHDLVTVGPRGGDHRHDRELGRLFGAGSIDV